MILIADSGSTKTHWCLIDKQQVHLHLETKGMNPFYQTTEEVCTELENNLIPHLTEMPIDSIHFYGAGCAFPEKNKIISSAIARYFNVNITIESDLMAAALALCGDKKGIACIMGTGSNSCFYDGKEIVANISPLGFILGDEGSGAVLGKLLVGDCLKNQLSPQLQKLFFEQYNLTGADILDKVYKQPFPNRFLASFSPFLLQYIHEPEIYKPVYDSFKSFFIRNVMQYDYQNNQVHFVGSIAYYFQEVLKSVAAELNIEIGQILQTPMTGLINYHLK